MFAIWCNWIFRRQLSFQKNISNAVATKLTAKRQESAYRIQFLISLSVVKDTMTLARLRRVPQISSAGWDSTACPATRFVMASPTVRVMRRWSTVQFNVQKAVIVMERSSHVFPLVSLTSVSPVLHSIS